MFSLPTLPYSFHPLEPYIDAQTMEIHYTKHHQAYLDKLNLALKQVPDLKNDSIEGLLSDLSQVPEDVRTTVRNNGGGYYNHMLFWNMMTAPEQSKMSKELVDLFNVSFGSVDEFKKKFAAEATARFGSGWVWLIVTTNGKLKIVSTQGHDNPLMTGDRPLMVIDAWEHAYYLHYQNRRPEYIENWWNVVDWKAVEKNYNSPE